MQHHVSAGPGPRVGLEKSLCGIALECTSNKPLPLQDLGENTEAFYSFRGSRPHLVSFPGEINFIYGSGSMEQSLILALILSQPVCLVPTPWHSFQPALFCFDFFICASRNPFFPFLSQLIPPVGRKPVTPAPVWSRIWS